MSEGTIQTIGLVVVALIGLAGVIYSARASRDAREAKAVSQTTAVTVDGRMTQLLAMAEEEARGRALTAHAAGVVQGAAEGLATEEAVVVREGLAHAAGVTQGEGRE